MPASAHDTAVRTERVGFGTTGEELIGDLRVPPGERFPALVFTGPFTGTRDQVVGTYAARLAKAGYVTLAFDHRGFGESGGTPRRHEDPQGKLADLRAAVSFLRSRPEVDGGRIAAVGICLGAGYALKFAAFDPRVRAFVGIAGAYNTPYAMRSAMGPGGYQGALAAFTEVLERQDLGGEVEYLPAVATEGEAAMPGQEPYDYYGTSRGASASWENSVTRASIRELITVDNMAGADFLAEPGLIVHGVEDAYCPPEGAREAYDRMPGVKDIVWLDARLHTDLYDDDTHVGRAVEATGAFLAEHL
ncbi:alpha/beta hydrolase [Actinomadura scrupuli]|uniref:alpha/beta hydrolase n=1 Tax=Actinomadura scrupuli TaxID=559629 RepID=UPI003D9749C4